MTNSLSVSIKKSLIDGYNRHAVYFSSSRNRPWEEIDQVAKQLPKGAKVLDLGCGNGRLLLSLRADCRYLGVDFSKNLIDEARRLHPRQKFVVADFTSDEFWRELGQFDAIFAIASFHHLEKSHHRFVFDRCFDHLSEKGYLVVSVWNLLRPSMWGYHLNSLWGKFTNGFRSVWISFRGDFSRYHWTFDRSELLDLARKSGFKIISCRYVSRGKQKNWSQGENLLLLAQKSSL